MSANYHLKNRKVNARRHDGSDDSAKELVQWVRENKGDAYAILKGEAELEGYLHDAYVVVKNSEGKISAMIRPNFWLVQLESGVFFGCYPDIFRRMFKPIKEVDHDQIVSTGAAVVGTSSV